MEDVLPGLRVVITDGSGTRLDMFDLNDIAPAALPRRIPSKEEYTMQQTKKRAGLGAVVALVVLALLLLGSSLIVTRSNEYSVIRQFGRWWASARNRASALSCPDPDGGQDAQHRASL